MSIINIISGIFIIVVIIGVILKTFFGIIRLANDKIWVIKVYNRTETYFVCGSLDNPKEISFVNRMKDADKFSVFDARKLHKQIDKSKYHKSYKWQVTG